MWVSDVTNMALYALGLLLLGEHELCLELLGRGLAA